MQDLLPPEERVRSPVVGGMFYPEEEDEALSRLAGFGLRPGKGGQASVIIAPHGAWDISGAVAGAAFSAAAGRTKAPARVVILGSIHNIQEEGLFLSESHCFSTPLGDIPVEQSMCDEFESCSKSFQINDIPHLREHSIEVLLPFVKYCFPKTKIIPILMGVPSQALVFALAGALRIVLEPVMDETLLVISCNLAADNEEIQALLKAEECVRLITEKDADAFCSSFFSGQISPCAGGPAAGFLKSGLGDALRPRFISDALSCARDDNNNTVCYGALSFE